MARLTAATVAASPDFDRIIVAEWEVARKLEGASWTAGSNAYWTSFTDGEVHRVEVNGTEYAEVFEDSATTSTFWYDTANQRLYITTADSDIPSTSGKYCVMAYFYIGLASDGVSLRRYREVLVDGKLDVWTSATALKYWSKSTTGTAALDRESADVYDALSAYSAKLSVGATSSEVYIYQLTDRIVRPGAPAMVRLKYRCADINSILKIMIRDSASNVWLKSDGTWQGTSNVISLPNSTAWTEYSLTFTAHASYSSYFFIVIVNENGHTAYVDNVELKRFYEPMFFLPYLGPGSVPSIRHSVGTFRDPSEELSLGTLQMVDDGYFASHFTTYLWDNKTLKVYIGAAGCTYDDLAPMFTGITRLPRLRDGSFSVELTDPRAEYRNLLQLTFDGATYANCEDAWKERPVPFLFGDVHGFQPPQQDTANRVYRLSQTVFGANTYALGGVQNVYANGVDIAGNWTADANNGTVTVTTGTANDTVTCDATGYTSNHEDFLYMLLRDFQKIPVDQINIKSLAELGSGRTITLSRWFSGQTNVRSVIDELKTSAQYFFFTRSDGEYFARTLSDVIPTGTQHFFNEDFTGFESWSATDQMYASVAMQYYAYTDLNNERYAVSSENRANWERGVKSDLTLAMLETTDAMAANVAIKYSEILQGPLDYIRTTLPAPALFIEPTDKVLITKSVIDANGTAQSLYNNDVFVVMEIEKDLAASVATITAIKSDPNFYWDTDSPGWGGETYSLSVMPGSFAVTAANYDALSHRTIQTGVGAAAVTGEDVELSKA